MAKLKTEKKAVKVEVAMPKIFYDNIREFLLSCPSLGYDGNVGEFLMDTFRGEWIRSEGIKKDARQSGFIEAAQVAIEIYPEKKKDGCEECEFYKLLKGIAASEK